MPGAPAQSEAKLLSNHDATSVVLEGTPPARLGSVPGKVRPQQEEVGATWQVSQRNLLML